jgi:hypothetical protein
MESGYLDLRVDSAGRITEARCAPLASARALEAALLGSPLTRLIAEEVSASLSASLSATRGAPLPLDLPLSPWGAARLGVPREVRVWALWEREEGGGGRLVCQLDTEGRWRRRLLSQRAGLRDLRHDLSGRLFLISALPDLHAHTAPEELIEDLLTDLPALTAFFEERAAPEWVSSPPTPPAPTSEGEARASLRALCARVSARCPALALTLAPASPSAPLLPPLSAPPPSEGAFVGVRWALARLDSALKAARRAAEGQGPLAPRPQGSQGVGAPPLSLHLDSLDPHAPHAPPLWDIDLCGRPRVEGALWRLTLRGGGVPWARWGALAPPPAPAVRWFAPAFMAGVEAGATLWEREAREWMEAWWVAADLLGGGLCAPRVEGGERGEEGEVGVALYWPQRAP